jgi:vancomycin resistance protein YoaR
MKWLLIVVTIFLFILTIIGGAILAYPQIYHNRFFPGVKILNQPLSGLDNNQAVDWLQKQVDDFLHQDLIYQFRGEVVKIPLILQADDPDVSRKLVEYKIDETVQQAFGLGRGRNYLSNVIEQIKLYIFGRNLALQMDLDQDELASLLYQSLNKFTSSKIDARPKFDQDLNLEITAEKAGTDFDYQAILNQTTKQISLLANRPIAIDLIFQQPEIKKADVTEKLLQQVREIVATSTITLFYGDENWPVSNQIFKDWLIFKKTNGRIELGLDASTTGEYLEKQIAVKINRQVLEAKFSIKNGRVTEFQASQDGLELDIEKTLAKMEEELFRNNNFKIDLIVGEIKSSVTTGSVNDYGIVEIIGIGHSKFSGSPKNRRANIKVGADSLNGILINPGEEFSLIKALGEIDASTGYKPELVIKGDRTIPEFGGGLCQIGTTVFRAAIASGLPITERRNHTYRVVYYEPAGKDATIYQPHPDMKFINDTGHNVLIQSRIEGDDLYFDFWGTKDGRLIEQSDSTIYNIKKPGPTQLIETPDLKPGEKNCVEKPHNGADAYFDYKVTYPNDEVKQIRFSSHYIPWPEKCLVGIEPTPATATSTPEILPVPNP